MKTDYEGASFQVHQNRNSRDLCQGTVGQYKGERDGIDFYAANITVTFNPGNVHEEEGEVAIGQNGEFFLTIKAGTMVNCSDQVEWL